MTSVFSLILAFMLTTGGSPAVSVSPVNSIVPEFGVSHDITGKPRLGEFLKIYPVGANPNAGNPRLVLNLSFQYKKSPLIDLNQAFNQNPVNFTDPFGTIIKKVDFYELKRIRESQGPDAAKRWIDRNPNFTSGEKLDLHMKVWFGFDDPDEILNILPNPKACLYHMLFCQTTHQER